METHKLLDILKNTLPPGNWDEFEKIGRINDEFESLRIARKAIRKRWREQSNDKFLTKGVKAFQKMEAWNVAKLSNILINQAYLYEYLENIDKSNECIYKAVKHRSDKSVLENAGRFFCHFTKRNIDHDQKWKAILEREDRYIGDVSKGTRLMVKLQKRCGNDASELTSKIIEKPQMKLRTLEDDLKQLLKLSENPGSTFRIDLFYMDRVIKSSLILAKKQFQESVFLNKCDVLFLILAKIMISARSHEDPDNFFNYANFVTSLYLGKINGLKEHRSVRKFYNKEEEYLERAIDLGEIKKSTTKPSSEHANRIYKSLSDMYRIRGNLKKKKGIEEQYVDDFEKAANVLGDLSASAQSIAKMEFQYGNDTSQLTSRIIENSKETLQDLENDLMILLKQAEKADISIYINLTYLDQVIGESLRTAKHHFSQSEFSTKYDILLLVLNKIMVATKSDDPDNCISYARYVESLYMGKRNGLDNLEETKRFYAEEEEYLEKAIELGEQKIVTTEFTDPDTVTIYCLLASMYRIRGHIKKKKRENEGASIRDFYRAVELFRQVGDGIYIKEYFDRNVERFAESLLFSGEYEAAISEYKKLFYESKTKEYQGALGLGRSYNEKGDFEKAEYWYLEAKKIDDVSPGAYDGMVHVKKDQGEYLEAIIWRKKMLKLPEISSDNKNYLHYDIANLYLNEGSEKSLEKAIVAFEKIIDNQETYNKNVYDQFVASLIELKGYKETIKLLSIKANLNKTGPKIRAVYFCLIGDCYSKMTDRPDKKEKESYQKALLVCPDYVPALQRFASWYVRSGKYKKAIKKIEYMIENIIDRDDSAGLWRWIAHLKQKNKDFLGAFEAYRQSFVIEGNWLDAQYETISQLQEKQGNDEILDSSIEELKTEFQKQPSSELAQQIVNLCLICSSSKYLKDAEKYLEKCDYQFDSTEYILNKIAILEVKEDYKEALKLRKEFIPLGNTPLSSEQQRLNNLKRVIQTIIQNQLYKEDSKFRNLRLKALDKMAEFLESKIGLFEETFLPDEIEEKRKEDIRQFREEILCVAGEYHRRGQYSLAQKWIRMLTNSQDIDLRTDKVYLFKEAEIHLSLDDSVKALKVLDKILKYENYEDALSFFLKGRIKRDYMKNFPEAVKCLNEAYEINESESIKDVPKVLDQLGLTYRKWAKQPDLNSNRRQELKNKAIENYQMIIDDFPGRFDRRAYHGLAQAYLLLEPSEEEFGLAGYYYYEILRNGLWEKDSIQKKDLDQITVFELLYLWEKAGDVTLKKILNGLSPLLINLEENDKNFIKWRIVQAAKRANIFEQDVFDTIKTVFQSASNESLRQHCCQYFMKYLIYTSYNTSENEFREVISTIIDMIISDSQEKVYIVENLVWFLAGERSAYLDLLTQELKENLDEISSLIFKLTKDDLDNKLEKISSHLEAAKNKLKNIGLTKVEPKNISKEIHSRSEDLHIDRIGNRIEFETNIFGLEGTIVSKKDWITKEDMILDCFDLMYDTGLYGTCTLNASGENDLVSIKVRAGLNGSHEEISEFHRKIKQKFTPKTSFKINKGTQESTGSPFLVFEIELWLEKITISDKNPFEKLTEFKSKNFFRDENQVVRLNEQINKKISSIDSTEVLKDKLTTHLYHQMVQLTEQAKDHLAVILDKPHKLKNWSERPPEEVWSTIEEIQINFQSLKLMTKQFYFSGEDISFSLSDIIDQHIKPHSSPNIPITFQREENSNYQIVGDKQSFEIMISNLCFNSVKSVKTKQKKEDKYKPEITVHLSTNNIEREYELRFRDNGVGLDPGTTIEDQELGFGLRAVSYFLHNCDGEITIEEACKGNNSGVTFLITLPIREEE